MEEMLSAAEPQPKRKLKPLNTEYGEGIRQKQVKGTKKIGRLLNHEVRQIRDPRETLITATIMVPKERRSLRDLWLRRGTGNFNHGWIRMEWITAKDPKYTKGTIPDQKLTLNRRIRGIRGKEEKENEEDSGWRDARMKQRRNAASSACAMLLGGS